MNKQDIRMLYEYNRWANARILGAAGMIREPQFLAHGDFMTGGLSGHPDNALFAAWDIPPATSISSYISTKARARFRCSRDSCAAVAECRRRKACFLDTRPGPRYLSSRHPSRRIASVAGV